MIGPIFKNVDTVAESGWAPAGLEFTWVDVDTIKANISSRTVSSRAYIHMWNSDGDQRVSEFREESGQEISLDSTGLNGLEAAAAGDHGRQADHQYNVYAIANNDDDIAFILVSLVDYNPGFPTAWDLPAGYEWCSNPLWYIRNDDSDEILKFEDLGGVCGLLGTHAERTVLDNGSHASYQDITPDLRRFVPTWARIAILRVYVNGTLNLSADGSTNTLDEMDQNHYITVAWTYGSLHYKRSIGGPYIRCQGWVR